MNIFEAVKQSVTTRQAAESYGIRVNKNGMAVCPFHRDKNPSMKVDRRFHCFGCQADGDVIDFTAHLYNLKPKEAVHHNCLISYFHSCCSSIFDLIFLASHCRFLFPVS